MFQGLNGFKQIVADNKTTFYIFDQLGVAIGFALKHINCQTCMC